MRTAIRLSSVFAFVITVALVCGVAIEAPAQQSAKQNFTYADVYGGGGRGGGASIMGRTPSITGWADADHYLESRTGAGGRGRQVYAVSAVDGSAEIYRDYSAIQANLPDGFDASQASATTPDLTGFVFQSDGDLYHYNANTERFRRLTATPSQENNPRFSPDGNWVAYTRDRNLYAYDLDGSVEHQYTTDATDVVYNGWASWVYFEEILGRGTRYGAFWWSPDSSQLAFLRFDDTPVPEFPIYHADGQHGELEVQRYPKAGDPNPWVKMGVVPVDGGDVVWMDFEEKADHYLAWPSFSPDSKTLRVQWMNRGQDVIRFYDCDPKTGDKTEVFEEAQDSWVSWFGNIHYFEDGSGYLILSNKSGWNHIYVHENDGTVTQLTSGDWRVNSVAEVDEAGGWVYFSGKPGNSWDTQLMRVRLDGTGLEQLTEGEGSHSARVSPGGKYFIDSFSDLHTPTKISLHSGDGTLVRELGNAKTEAFDDYNWGTYELFTITSDDGQYELPATWVLPPDFDESKQYPVLFSIYGGPNSGGVSNRWRGQTPHYWAQRGVITINVDHRASGHFGKAGVALMHRRLGHWEMTDLIAAAKWLRTQPFVDPDKIAITGSSYGGYTTMMALTYGADHFNYGQAGASVSDWKLYDTVYTERYMDTPLENPEGYNGGAVLTYVDRYKGGLRITHGMIDDNVHAQNSVQIVDWLMVNNKDFEMFFYPDSRHGVQSSMRAHYSKGIHDFWIDVLLDGVDPLADESGR